MDFLKELGPGDVLGGYTIVRPLGEGGMGVVFEARDPSGRPVALKVLSSWLATELGRQRFELEIEVCAQLRHPNTVAIYDYGEHEDGTLYYAMEFLDGFDLSRLVDLDGPQSAARTIRILDQIAGALGEAHEKHLIHRDIKPPNIVLCEREGAPDIAKLLDFGLVLPTEESGRRLTQEGQVLGTPRYAPPESLRANGKLSPASDFYALGLVGYFLLCGRHAFDGEGAVDILRKQREDPPEPIRGVPNDLESVVYWCLEKDPENRPREARTLREALAGCADASRWNEPEAIEWWATRRSSLPELTSDPPPTN